jgi:exodeoxyribonuclease III
MAPVRMVHFAFCDLKEGVGEALDLLLPSKVATMLLLSWNVAGWSHTVNKICLDYPVRGHPAASLAAFFERHGGADVVCLQEHKIGRRSLSNRREPRQAASVPGYESFWSCCVSERQKGFNGVVTYAKIGTVLAADSSPLGSAELDDQGRCIMTDHGNFVLFNVYVPNAGGQPLSYKMKFLNALRRAMKHQREVCKRPVILVGDLNIKCGPKDIYWKNRVIHVDDVLQEVTSATGEQRDRLPRWKIELQEHWPKIEAALRNKEVVETQTTNPRTGEKFDKFRLCVKVNGKQIFLGSSEEKEEYCLYMYDFRAQRWYDEESDREILISKENTVCIDMLAELMNKIAGVEWDEGIMRSIAETDATIEQLSPSRKWLHSVLREDGMIDAFRHFYPEAEGRFTCWNQNKNRRYVNEGSRIDYTLVDRSLIGQVLPGEGLRCCGKIEAGQEGSEKAALLAATANGHFQPAAFDGGGISDATQTALDTQFGPAHTGMVYTPPSYSDHTAISLLMNDSVLPRDQILQEKDHATKKTQPHKKQQSIASFFTSGSDQTASKPKATHHRLAVVGKKKPAPPSTNGKSSKRPKAGKAKIPANSVLHHFHKK